MTQSRNRAWYKFIIALLVCFFVIGIVPVFSQQILASAGLAVEKPFDDYHLDYSSWDNAELWLEIDANVLFVGNSGFTISAGANVNTNVVSFAPVLGLGYVFYNTIYLGGILNVIPQDGMIFIAPTLVGGFDFGTFLLEARLLYMRGYEGTNGDGYNNGMHGFRFSIGAGVNLGSGGAYR